MWLAVTGFLFSFFFLVVFCLGLFEFFQSALLQHEQIQSYCHPVCCRKTTEIHRGTLAPTTRQPLLLKTTDLKRKNDLREWSEKSTILTGRNIYFYLILKWVCVSSLLSLTQWRKESVKLKHKAKTVAFPRRLQRHSNDEWVNEWVNRDESRLTCRCTVIPFPFHFLLDHTFALHYHKTEPNAYLLHSVQVPVSCSVKTTRYCECVMRCDKKAGLIFKAITLCGNSQTLNMRAAGWLTPTVAKQTHMPPSSSARLLCVLVFFLWPL